MKNLKLPSIIGNREAPCLPDARQLTIIGGSGAGKTKFMENLMDLTGDRTFCLSAIRAPFPEREESRRPGSIDMLYQEAIKSKSYMRTNAVSELEKLTYMLFADEFESLLKLKERSISNQRQKNIKPTKLDQLIKIWERIFPDNRIIFSNGSLMFSTGSGNDIIPVERLSQGEMAVLYYVAGVLYAMREAVIYIDAPSLFLHPTVLNALWNEIESLRPDCKFVYNSVDVEFVSSRTRNVILWVKSYDAAGKRWDYEIIAPGELREDIFIELIGGRKPVLFIEGDMSHSIDARLYPLVFPEFTVKPLGSCDKVIETTRSFNDLSAMHHLASKGIVDRDRRTDREVEYLRKKSVMVPEVAEIENFFLLEEVVKQMAALRGRNKESVFRNIKKRAFDRFRCKLQQQAMEHVRHRIKREVDSKIDAKFPCITAMEAHLRKLIKILEPRKHYNEIISRFNQIIREENYRELLKVFNHKPLINECGVVESLGYKSKEEYVRGVICALKNGGKEADIMREAIRRSLHPEN